MHCTACDTSSEPGDRFCQACGATLAGTAPGYVISNAPVSGAPCPTCRQRNPDGAKYCVFCATQMIPAAPAATPAIQPEAAGNVGGVYAAQPLQANFATPGNLLIRAVWFFLIGWWLGLIWTVVAWLFNLTLIGLPVGLMMLNAIPMVSTLHHRGRIGFYPQRPVSPSLPLAIRALWFVFVGWWASLLWSLAAWVFCITILLMPIAFWMYDRVPTVATLAPEY